MRKILLVLVLFLTAFVYANEKYTISVIAPQEGAAKMVTVGGKSSSDYSSGARAPLVATAAAGWAFAGWYENYDAETGMFSNKVSLASDQDWRTPNAGFIVGNSSKTLYARFVTPAEDCLEFDFSKLFSGMDGGSVEMIDISFTNEYDVVAEITSETLPNVTVTGLPKGLAFNKSTMRLLGKPTEPGLFRVKVSASNVSKYSFSQIFDVKVGNYASEVIEGLGDESFELGEEVDCYADDLFDIRYTGAPLKSLTMTGLPPGLSLRLISEEGEVYYTVGGMPTKAGLFTVKATAVFQDGKSGSATTAIEIWDVDPFLYEVDFSVCQNLQVGDTITIEDGACVGVYDKEWKVGIQSIAGLPAGITVDKISDEYEDAYYLKGTVTKPGEYKVSVRVAYEDWDTERIMTTTLTQTIVVSDVPNKYFSVMVDHPEKAPGCKATGSKVCSMASTVRINATSAPNYVFAGWHSEAGVPISSEGKDYRTAGLGVLVDNNSETTWVAHFIPKTEDLITIEEIQESYDLDLAVGMQTYFNVKSCSLPRLTFKGLPTGVECLASQEFPDEYSLSYNPEGAKSSPTPGKYIVSLTAENLSKNKSVTEFLIKVANITNENIRVLDDYGVVTPDIAITPISFSNAVDFARGDMLTITGLPAGLKYNDKSAPMCISGIPTKPGEYTLEFNAKIVTSALTNGTRVVYTYENAKATAFITVKNFPEIEVNVSASALAGGNKVTGAGNYRAGSKVMLRATPSKGWVFAGWTNIEGLSGIAALNPSFSYQVGVEDVTSVGAEFVNVSEDYLWIDDIEDIRLEVGETILDDDASKIADSIRTRSLPTITIKSLPIGLRWDAKSYLVTGKPTKAGVYYVEITAKNAGGYKHSRIVRFIIGNAAEIAEENGAGISIEDFGDFNDGLYTGNFGFEKSFILPMSSSNSRVHNVIVRGLPASMKYGIQDCDGKDILNVYGSLSKPGRITVTIEVTYTDKTRAKTVKSFIVRDSGSRWLNVAVEQGSDGMGTVSGSGVYAYGEALKIKATAGRNNVFIGWYGNHYASDYDGGDWISGNIEEWYDECWITDAKGMSVDYRTPSLSTAVLDDDIFETEWYPGRTETVFARFTTVDDDSAIRLFDGNDMNLDASEYTVECDENGYWGLDIRVKSKSLPGKILLSGLTGGMKLQDFGDFVRLEVVDPSKLQPGVYTFIATVSNASKANGIAVFTVVVPNFTTPALPSLNPAIDAYPIHVGTMVSKEMFDFTFGEGWENSTITATGLPTGLKLVKKIDEDGALFYVIDGVPTRASTNTVTFKVVNSMTKETAIATITIAVSALPSWVVGNFDGVYSQISDDSCKMVGTISATVSSQGRISGKILGNGVQYSFSATKFTGYQAEKDAFVANIELSWSATNKVPYEVYIIENEMGLGEMKIVDSRVCCGMSGEGEGVLIQNMWKRSDLYVPIFPIGAQALSYVYGDLLMKFSAGGAVTVSGRVGNVTVSGRTQVICKELTEEGGFLCEIPLYFTNRLLEDKVYVDLCEIKFFDNNKDGKFDSLSE